MPKADFPKIENQSLVNEILLDSTKLKNIIDKTRFAISNEETRYYLNGIYMFIGGKDGEKQLRAVSTDGHRLAKVEYIKEIEEQLPNNPSQTIRELNAIMRSWYKNRKLVGVSLKLISGKTDQGSIIKNNGISIDKVKTKNKIEKWIHQFEKNSIKESRLISKYSPNLIISDVSAMPLISAKKNKKFI